MTTPATPDTSHGYHEHLADAVVAAAHPETLRHPVGVHADHAATPDVQIVDVTKRFGDVVAVDGMRLSVERGSFYSFLGPSGCGKTTTLRMLFATSFDVIQALTGVKLNFGHPTIIAAHVLFNTSLVLLLVRARLSGMDRTLIEASYDLFASPWRTFRQVTLPILMPAIVAGFLLAFTFSFDDYVITTFVSGPGSSTLPLFIFGQVKRGVTPETNAVATMILAFTILMLLVAQLGLVLQGRRQGQGSSGMARIIAERG